MAWCLTPLAKRLAWQKWGCGSYCSVITLINYSLIFFWLLLNCKKNKTVLLFTTSTACTCYDIPVCHNTHAVSIVQSVCVNCRSAGQKDNGQQGLCCPARPSLPLYVAFPSVQIIIRACVSVPWLTAPLHTHARTAATHTKKQKHAHNHITITQNFTGLGNEALFFQDLVTCSYISSFHHRTKHPGNLYPAWNNTEPRPSGCFYMVINWWLVRESVDFWLFRVKSTALGVIH